MQQQQKNTSESYSFPLQRHAFIASKLSLLYRPWSSTVGATATNKTTTIQPQTFGVAFQQTLEQNRKLIKILKEIKCFLYMPVAASRKQQRFRWRGTDKNYYLSWSYVFPNKLLIANSPASRFLGQKFMLMFVESAVEAAKDYTHTKKRT